MAQILDPEQTDLTQTPSQRSVSSLYALVPQASCVVAALVAAIVLMAWSAHAYALVTVLPHLPAMAQSTAAAFLLASASLWLQRTEGLSGGRRRAGQAFALATVAVGLITLTRYWLFPLDYKSLSLAGITHPINHMSPNSALNFVLLGAALFLIDVRGKGDRWPAQMLAFIVLLDTLAALVGQFYGITFLYGLSHFLGMAVHTAILCLLLSLGLLLARPDRGFVSIVLADDAAGRAARRFLPLALVAPILLGGVGMLSQRLHQPNSPFIAYLLVVASIGLLGWLVWGNVLALSVQVRRSLSYERQLADFERGKVENALHVSEDALHASEDALHASEDALLVSEDALLVSEEKLRVLFGTMTQAVVYQDLDGTITSANPAALRVLGLALSELTGRVSADPRWQAVDQNGAPLPGEQHPPMQALTTRKAVLGMIMGIFNPHLNETRWLRVDSLPQFHPGEAQPYQVYSLFEDITEERRAMTERQEAAIRHRTFLRDVLASVTEGKLILCDTDADLPALLAPFAHSLSVSTTDGLHELRQVTYQACQNAGISMERSHDLVTAASEAGMNAAVYAGSGTGQVTVGENGTVQVRVEDGGSGISMENLPRATLARGFSTKATLGHGLKLMLETADRLYLLTGPGGTTVVLEQERDSPRLAWL